MARHNRGITMIQSYCCKKCGENIGWIGRFLFPFLHKCNSNILDKLAEGLDFEQSGDRHEFRTRCHDEFLDTDIHELRAMFPQCYELSRFKVILEIANAYIADKRQVDK